MPDMTDAPSEPTGAPLELLHRLVLLLDQQPALGLDWTFELGFFAGLDLGVVPAREESGSAFLTRLVEHVGAILALHVNEAVLIRASRDRMTEGIDSLADVGKAMLNRGDSRDLLQRMLDDPFGMDQARMDFAELTEGKSDEEIRHQLLHMIQLLQPPQVEHVAEVWALRDQYRRERERFLSDDVLDTWEERKSRRS